MAHSETAKTPTEDDLIVCPICYEVFHEPKCLTVCLHTFCKSCITSYVTTTLDKSGNKFSGFHCPVCREFYDTGNNSQVWLENLPNNHLIVNLIHRNKMETKTTDNYCDICQRMNQSSVHATSWCFDCCEKLCETCTKFHRGSKPSMDHEIVDLEKSRASRSREMIYCEKHTNKKLEVYCFDHDTPCCLMCATVQHRKCEKVESLEECSLSGKTKQEVSDVCKLCKQLREQCKRELKKLTSDKEKYLTKSEEIRSQIKTSVETAIRHLKEKEVEIEQNLNSFEKKIDIHISDKVSALKDTETKIEKCIEQLEARNSLNDVELFLMFKRTEKDCNTVRSLLAEANEKYEKYFISLKLNDRMENFTKTLRSVGEVCFKTHTPYKTDFLSDSLTLEKIIDGPSGERITDIEIIADTHIVAVGDGHNSVHLFSIDGTLLVTHKLSSGPLGMTCIPGCKLAVAIQSPNTIEIVNISIGGTPSLSTERNIKLSFQPRGIAFHDDKFVVNSLNIIYNVDQNGNILTQSQNIGTFLNRLHLQSNGGMICTNNEKDGLKLFCKQKINDSSNVFEFRYSSLTYPLGVTTDTDGNIYVVGYGTDNVCQLNPDGTFVRQIICHDQTLSNPLSVRVCSIKDSPRLFLTEYDKIRIYRFDKNK